MIKTIKKVILVILLAVILLLNNGCEDTTVTTEIFPDGSCKRVMNVKSDSRDIFKHAFYIPEDTSWTVEEKWEKKEKKSTFDRSNKVFVYTAEKSFPSVSDLNDEWSAQETGAHKVNIDVKLDKRFAWFFTYYHYREIYRDFFPFKKQPLKGHFTPEELKIIKLSLGDEDEEAEKLCSEETLKKIEKKFDVWVAQSIFNEFYNLFLEGAEQLKSPELTREHIVSKKEALFAACLKLELFEPDSPTTLLKKSEDILQTQDVWKVWEINKKGFSQFEEKYRAIDSLIGDEYTSKIIMPGLVTDTNAETIEGSTVTWTFAPDEFFITDYEMWVTSRRVNWWIVGIAAFLLLLVLAALIAGAVRRKRVG
jgi:hypothetical protein